MPFTLGSILLRCVIILCLLGFLVNAGQAKTVRENYTAERMLELCNGSVAGEEPRLQSMVCTFRIQGISQVMVQNCLSKEHGFSPAPVLTAKPPPSRGAARQAYRNFMELNPDKWGLPWHVVVAMALAKTFPCEKLPLIE